jgi:hypothetical protein
LLREICHWKGPFFRKPVVVSGGACLYLVKKILLLSVVGFAFLVPDTGWNECYLSYCLTHPDWQAAGIGTTTELYIKTAVSPPPPHIVRQVHKGRKRPIHSGVIP